jgi:hypothetical protein
MPRFPMSDLAGSDVREFPHGAIGEPPAGSPRTREGTGSIAPASVLSPAPETLGLSNHPAGWTASRSQPHAHRRNSSTMDAPGGHAHDGAVGAPSAGKANASADAPNAASRWEAMDLESLLDEIMVDDLLHFGLRRPEDAWTSGDAAGAVSSRDVQPGTSTGSSSQVDNPHSASSQATSHPKLLDLAPTMENPPLMGAENFSLKHRTPVFEFRRERLPVESPIANAAARLSGNRKFLTGQVASLLERSRYRIDGRSVGVSPMLLVTDLDSDRKFRIFVGAATQDVSAAPIGNFVKGSDLLAKVTIDPHDGRTLKSLYLIPLRR